MQGVRQIIDLQQDLVDAIRLELDDTRPSPRTINADEMVERACKSNMTLARDLDITLRGARSRIAFVADERWVERILNNLVANAIWHSNGQEDSDRRTAHKRRHRIRSPRQRPRHEARSGRRHLRTAKGAIAIADRPIGRTLRPWPLQRAFVHRAHGRHGHLRIHATARHAVSHHPARPDHNRCAAPRLRDVGAKLAKNKLVAILDDDVSVLRTTERLFGSWESKYSRTANLGVAQRRGRDEANAGPGAARLSVEGWRLHDVP